MTYVIRDGYLMHAEERKKHKYYAKVKISEDKTRYFYSKEEYQAYLNGKRKGKDGKTIGERGRGAVEGFLAKASKVAGDAKSNLSKATSDAQKGLSKLASNVQEGASKAIDQASRAIQNGKRVASNAMKQTTKAVSEFVASGKAATVKALNNAKKTAAQTLDKAKKSIGKAAKSARKKAKKAAIKAKQAASSTVSKAGNALSKAKKAVSKNLKKGVKTLSKFATDGKKAVSRGVKRSARSISKFVSNGKKVVSANLKKATASVSKFVAKGKRAVSNLLPKPIKDRINASRKEKARAQQLEDKRAREAKAKIQQATVPTRRAALDRSAKHQNGRGGKDEPDYESQSTAMRKSLSEISKNDPFPQFDKKDHYANRSEDLLMVNPNFEMNPFSDYAVNCSYCGLTYEMRRRGYDVEAKPLADDDCTEILRQWTMYKQFDITEEDIADVLSSGKREPYEAKIGELAERYGVFTNRRFAEAINKELGYGKLNPDQVQTNSTAIKENLSNSEISKMSTEYMLSQGEGARGVINVYWDSGGGHCMNWEVTNGQAVIYDSQTNETHTVSEICECSVPHTIYRTDNLELSSEATDWVKSSSGRKNKNNR